MGHGLEGRDKIKREVETGVRGLEERTKRMGLVVSDKKETCAVSKKLCNSGTLEGVKAVYQELSNADSAVTREFQTVWQKMDALIAENERAKKKLESGESNSKGNAAALDAAARQVSETKRAKQDLRGGKRESVKDVRFFERVGKQQNAGIRKAEESRSAYKQTLQSTKLDNKRKEIEAAIRWAQDDCGLSSASEKEAPAEISEKDTMGDFELVPDGVTDVVADGNSSYGLDGTLAHDAAASRTPETDRDREAMMALGIPPRRPLDTQGDLPPEERGMDNPADRLGYIREVETYKPKKYQ